jgi:predicted phage-related endonuclease
MMSNQEKSRLDFMAEELESLKKDLSEVKALIKDMHNLLAGNPIDKDSNGLIGDFKRVEKEVYAIKAELKKYKSYFYALVTLIGLGVVKVIIEFLKG